MTDEVPHRLNPRAFCYYSTNVHLQKVLLTFTKTMYLQIKIQSQLKNEVLTVFSMIQPPMEYIHVGFVT